MSDNIRDDQITKLHTLFIWVYFVLLCNVFSENIGEICYFEVWNVKPVIPLVTSTLILLQIDIGFVADMETTWMDQKDG